VPLTVTTNLNINLRKPSAGADLECLQVDPKVGRTLAIGSVALLTEAMTRWWPTLEPPFASAWLS
jgi:hypothetical protein